MRHPRIRLLPTKGNARIIYSLGVFEEEIVKKSLRHPPRGLAGEADRRLPSLESRRATIGEAKQKEMTFAIPDFLSHLPRFGEYPVPFTQMWIDGKPDFRVVDPEKSIKCIQEKLCAICGVRSGEFCYFIGGHYPNRSSLFVDPPMHEQCALFVSKVCPFVSGQRDKYSKRPVDEKVMRVHEMASAVRPDVMYILKSRTKNFGTIKLNGSLMIQAGQWSRIMEIS